MAAQQRRHRRPLIVGHQMHCPRCKELQDILAFEQRLVIEEFEAETAPVYKCRLCRWEFAPIEIHGHLTAVRELHSVG